MLNNIWHSVLPGPGVPSAFLIKARYHYTITPLANPASSSSPVSYARACLLGQQRERLSAIALPSLDGRELGSVDTCTSV